MNMFKLFFTAMILTFTGACTQDGNRVEKDSVNITDARIKLFKQKIEQDPSAYVNYNNLAQYYMQKARETGDHSYYSKAQQTLDNSLAINPDNYTGIVLRSKLAISGHRFQKALAYAEKAVELKPERSFSQAVLGDALLELGEIEKAMKAYRKMHEIDPGLESFSRISRVKFLKGDTKGAIESMQNAYESGLKSSIPEENLAWTQVMIGLHHFNTGNLEKAERHYLKSLNIKNDYYLGLEHLAELNAKRGDLEKAKEQYIKVLEINPAPEFHLALSGVYYELGDSEKGKQHNRIARVTLEKKVKNGDKGYLRVLSNYYIDNNLNPEKALDLAQQDFELRKDIYTYDTLAWAYYKNNHSLKAEKLIEQVLEHGTQDAKLYYHAGMINLELKNYREANKYLSKVLEINPEFETGDETDIRELISNEYSRTL